MNIFDDPGGRYIEIRKGGGCLTLFGMPFLLAGLAVIAGSLGFFGQRPPDISALFGVLFGLAFTTVGAMIAFWRGGVKIDRHGTVTSWWGLIGPWKTTDRRLTDFQAVRIAKEVRNSNNSTYTIYPVRIASNRVDDVKIQESQKYEDSRQLAERLAKFTSLPLIDASSGSEVVRQPDHLDMSLKDQLRTTGPGELPDPPPNLRSTIRKKGRDIMIEPPQQSAPWLAGLLVIPFIIIPFIMMGIFFSMFKNSGNQGTQWLIFAFPVIATLPLILLWKRKTAAFTTTQRLIVSPEQGIRLESVRKNGVVQVKNKLSAHELEEIVVPKQDIQSLAGDHGADTQIPEFVKAIAAATGKTGMVLRGDTGAIVFGGTLDREELLYLERLIKHTLAG